MSGGQLDLLDLLVEAEPPPGDPTADPTAAVISRWLGPHGLNRVIRALGTRQIDDVRRGLASEHERGCGGPDHQLKGSRTGIVVDKWPGVEPFTISWNQLFATIRARTTPELAETLAAACDGYAGGTTPEQRAASHAILPCLYSFEEVLR